MEAKGLPSRLVPYYRMIQRHIAVV